MGEKIIVGLRKVVKNGYNHVAITLPPQLRYLKGKSVVVTLELWEPQISKKEKMKSNSG